MKLSTLILVSSLFGITLITYGMQEVTRYEKKKKHLQEITFIGTYHHQTVPYLVEVKQTTNTETKSITYDGTVTPNEDFLNTDFLYDGQETENIWKELQEAYYQTNQ